MIKTVEIAPSIWAAALAKSLVENPEWLIFENFDSIDWIETHRNLQEVINDFLN